MSLYCKEKKGRGEGKRAVGWSVFLTSILELADKCWDNDVVIGGEGFDQAPTENA